MDTSHSNVGFHLRIRRSSKKESISAAIDTLSHSPGRFTPRIRSDHWSQKRDRFSREPTELERRRAELLLADVGPTVAARAHSIVARV